MLPLDVKREQDAAVQRISAVFFNAHCRSRDVPRRW
jgi:hypothetical protein